MALERYMALVKRFPLRPMRDEAQYEAGVELLKELALGYDDLTPEETDYFDALSQFVAEYEREHYRHELPRMEPVEALQFLMAENGMTVADLGRVLGSASAASMILSGKRELSKTHIRLLASHFSVDAGLFLGTDAHCDSDALAGGSWAGMVVECKAQQPKWNITQKNGLIPAFANGFQYKMAG